MTKLRISAIPDSRPVKLTIELPADIFRDLEAYAALVPHEGERPEPARLIPLMIQHFIRSDRAFSKLRRT